MPFRQVLPRFYATVTRGARRRPAGAAASRPRPAFVSGAGRRRGAAWAAAVALAAAWLALGAGESRADFPANLYLGELDGDDGFTVAGVDTLSEFALAVGGIGDLNGDGIADFAIGDPEASPFGRGNAGQVSVIFGRGGGFPARFNIAALDGTNGFRIAGRQSGNRLHALAPAGDVNGDGISDLLMGAEGASPNGGWCDGQGGGLRCSAGEVYVIWGRRDPFPALFDLRDLAPDGTRGLEIWGIESADAVGGSVAGGADLSGDGRVDLVLGGINAGRYSPNGGAAYVLFNRPGGLPPVIDLAQLAPGDGVTLSGPVDSAAGTSVAGIGDLDGDGVSDLAVGAPEAQRRLGRAYVVFGGPDAPLDLDLDALNGDNGFIVQGAVGDDRVGVAVAPAGDLNADGWADLWIGSYGDAFAVYGRPRPWPRLLDLGSIDGNNGVRFTGGELNQGGSVGDLDADGRPDLAFTDWRGIAWVLFGAPDFPALVEVPGWLDGRRGFSLVMSLGRLGQGGVGPAGDVNADGVDDLAIGDPGGNLSVGEAYAVFGRRPQGMTLLLAGSCPGRADLTIEAATPAARVTLYAAAETGEELLPDGPCRFKRSDLGPSLRAVGTVIADPDGRFSTRVRLPQFSCHGWLQAVDEDSCALSNVEATP